MVTGLSFQFAARRLRVLLRGVFHLRLATILSVIRLASTRAVVSVFSAAYAQSAARLGANPPRRHRSVRQLRREVRDVQPLSHQDVVIVKRIAGGGMGFQPFAHLDVHGSMHFHQTAVAFAEDLYVDGAVDFEEIAGRSHVQAHARGLRKAHALEWFQTHGTIDLQTFPPASDQPADIHFMQRTHNIIGGPHAGTPRKLASL